MDIVEKIKSIDVSVYPEMWCSLNHYIFPKQLTEFKPESWDLLPDNLRYKHPVFRKATDYIESVVSRKELLRYHNRERMPGVEFDIWWENYGSKPITEEMINLLKVIFKATNTELN